MYRQITIDSLLPDTPDNEQNTNALSTGPNYRLHVNRHNNIDLEGRYETFYFEQTNADNDRLNAAARWLYEQTSIFTLGVNYEMESVFFDTNDIYNYDRYDVFLVLTIVFI